MFIILVSWDLIELVYGTRQQLRNFVRQLFLFSSFCLRSPIVCMKNMRIQ